MDNKEKTAEGTTSTDDNVSNNAHYDKDGNISREDDRDRHNSADDWNAEENRTGRHK
jgi:YD repeat-containing protein